MTSLWNQLIANFLKKHTKPTSDLAINDYDINTYRPERRRSQLCSGFCVVFVFNLFSLQTVRYSVKDKRLGIWVKNYLWMLAFISSFGLQITSSCEILFVSGRDLNFQCCNNYYMIRRMCKLCILYIIPIWLKKSFTTLSIYL